MKVKATMPLTLLPPEAVGLGRFVTNKKSPAEEYFESGSLLNTIRGNILVTPRNNFREVLEYTSGTSAQSTLTTIISSHSTFEILDRIQMESLFNKTYQLQNSTAIFESICEGPDARKWLLKMIKRGRSIHMVVGFETITNAHISLNNRQTKERGGEVTAPISSALTAALAVPFPLTDVLDIGVGASKTKGYGVEASFFTPGEMVFAVQYRKLEFSWFSSRDIDNANLRKSQWRINIGVRSLEKSKENDVIDARLETDSPDADSTGIEDEKLQTTAEFLDIGPLDIQLCIGEL